MRAWVPLAALAAWIVFGFTGRATDATALDTLAGAALVVALITGALWFARRRGDASRGGDGGHGVGHGGDGRRNSSRGKGRDARHGPGRPSDRLFPPVGDGRWCDRCGHVTAPGAPCASCGHAVGKGAKRS